MLFLYKGIVGGMQKVFIKKLWEQRKIFVSLIVLGLLFVAGYIYYANAYLKVEFELTSTNVGEPVCIFYMDENMRNFDDEHMIQEKIANDTHRYSFNVKILVDLEAFEQEAEILCIKVNMTDGDDSFIRTFQLRLPKDKNGCFEYMLPEDYAKMHSLKTIEVEDSYAIYGSGTFQVLNK